MTGPVAFLLPSLAAGGAERVAISVIRHLVACGHRVDLLLLDASGALMDELPREVRVVDLAAKRMRQSVVSIARYLRRERPVVLQASMWPLTVIATLAGKLTGNASRIVISDHAILTSQYPGSRLLPTTARWTYGLADVRIAVSDGVARDIASFTGLSASDFVVINNPIDFPSETETAAPLLPGPWSGARHRILNVGNLKFEKQQVMLVDAFAEFAATHPDSALTIVGEGELREAIETRARNRGVSDRVTITGFVRDPWPYYRAATMFVLASQQEGYGNVLIEALYAGLPIVSTDCPTGPREILGDDEFGLLVPERTPLALAAGMNTALTLPVDADHLRQRALDLSGPATLERYREVLLGC